MDLRRLLNKARFKLVKSLPFYSLFFLPPIGKWNFAFALTGLEIIIIAGRIASNKMKEQLQVVKLAGGNNSHWRIMTRNESFFFDRDLLLQYSTK